MQYFSYDCENRLVRAETFQSGRLESKGEYRYDSLGRWVAKRAEIGGVEEQKRFLWQGLRMLRQETPGRNIVYLYEPESYAPLARIDQMEGEGHGGYYFHTDQIGTPLELTECRKIYISRYYRSREWLYLYSYASNPLTWIDPLGWCKSAASGRKGTKKLSTILSKMATQLSLKN